MRAWNTQESAASEMETSSFDSADIAHKMGAAASLVLLVLIGVVSGIAIPQFGLLTLAGIGIAFVGLVAFFRPSLALFIFAGLLYGRVSENLTLFHGVPSIAPVFALLVLAALVYRDGRAVMSRVDVRAWLPFVAYGLVLIASSLSAVNLPEAHRFIISYVRDMFFIGLIVVSVRDMDDVHLIIRAMLIIGLMLSLIAIYQIASGSHWNFGGFAQYSEQIVVSGEIDFEPRPSGQVGDPNFFALALLMLVPLGLYTARHERRGVLRWLALVTVVVACVAIFQTYSRGGYLALAVVLGLSTTAGLISRTVLIGSVLTVLIVIPFLPARYLDRISTVRQASSALLDEGEFSNVRAADSSVAGRMSQLGAAILMFRDHPLLGVGVANSANYYQEYARPMGIVRRSARHIHSLFVEIAAETGIIGLAVFTWMVAAVIRRLRQARRAVYALRQVRDLVDAVTVTFCGVLTASIFLHAAYPIFIWILFGLALATELAIRPLLHASRDVTKMTPGKIDGEYA